MANPKHDFKWMMKAQSKLNIAERVLIEKLIAEHLGEKIEFSDEEQLYICKDLLPETQETIKSLQNEYKSKYGSDWLEDDL